MSGRTVLRLHPKDNVATALAPLDAGAVIELDGQQLTLHEPIPLCHKLALADLPPGTIVTKYGQPIGRTTAEIPAGCHVHVHNMQSRRGQGRSGSC